MNQVMYVYHIDLIRFLYQFGSALFVSLYLFVVCCMKPWAISTFQLPLFFSREVLYASDRSLQDAQLGEDVAGFGAGDKIGAGVW